MCTEIQVRRFKYTLLKKTCPLAHEVNDAYSNIDPLIEKQFHHIFVGGFEAGSVSASYKWPKTRNMNTWNNTEVWLKALFVYIGQGFYRSSFMICLRRFCIFLGSNVIKVNKRINDLDTDFWKTSIMPCNKKFNKLSKCVVSDCHYVQE